MTNANPNAATRFAPGNQFGARRSASGFARAKRRLSKFLTRPENLELLVLGWSAALNKDPMLFWSKVVQPNIPKDLALQIDAEDPEAIGRAIYAALVAMQDRESRGPGGNGDGDNGSGSHSPGP